MKQLWLLLLILPIILWTSCETESLPSETPQSLPGNILSRSNGIESLPEGSKILLNALGGVIIEDEIFTYNNGSWSNSNGYQWENTSETTYITALHPHDISSLYEEGALKDILIAQDTLSQGETDITLNFKHLFASFTLNVEESLIDEIAEIKLTSPKTIESISSITGEITLSNTSTTTILSGNNSSSYEFIIPPMEASLSLAITLQNGTDQTYTLNNHLFECGFKYECTLRDGTTIPGIRNAVDLIDFSLIINGKKTGNLTKYGEKQADGRMLYRLLANIDFENVDSKNLLPIGFNNSPNIAFNDIFDGLGYTISNLTIPDKSINTDVYKDCSGIFGYIGESGIVRNLHIKGAKTTGTTTCTYIGGIAGKNTGLILNCSVQDSNLEYSNSNSETSIRIGGICASMSNGYIINCHTTNNVLKTNKTGAVGGVIGDSCGEILNCYTYGNTFSVPNGAYAGGIIGTVSTSQKLVLANSYVLHFKAPKYWGAIIGLLQQNKLICDNLFYNGGNLIANNLSTSTPNINLYQQFSLEENGELIHISKYLNNWINTVDKTKYPFDFRTWEKSTIDPFPAIFTP